MRYTARSKSGMAALALALALLAFAGCSSGSQGASTTAAPAAESPSAATAAESADASSPAAPAATEEEAAENPSAASNPAQQEAPETESNDEANGPIRIVGDATKTGTLSIPSAWIDTSSLLDPTVVADYDIVQYADPNTRYTSAALNSVAYSSCIRMQQFSASPDDIAKQVVSTYESSDMYGDVTTQKTSFNGHEATIIGSQLTKDNLTLTDIVIDKNGDGKACVLITVQSMPTNIEDALGYTSSWRLETE